MPWPPWTSSSSSSSSSPTSSSPTPPHPPTALHQYWDTYRPLLLPTLTLTTVALLTAHLYRTRLRRIPSADAIPHHYFTQHRTLTGTVTSVGDGDGFRIYHTPGGRLLGWHWLRAVPAGRGVKDTVHIRLAGVDAPEGAHFGRIAQPGAGKALDWLREYLLGRTVTVTLYRRDQYGRAVAGASVWKGWWRRDVGAEMLERGLAIVYEAKTGAEFGGREERYKVVEMRARRARRGIWRQRKVDFVSPGQYKKAVKEAELRPGTVVKV